MRLDNLKPLTACESLPNKKEKETNKMANNELLNKIEALNEWEALMEEARAEAEAIANY